MSTSIPYQESYKCIEQAQERSLILFDQIIKKVEGFTGTLEKFVAMVTKIPNELPNKRAKKNVFSKIRGPMEISTMEPAFTSQWNELCSLVLTSPPGMEKFVNDLKNLCMEKLQTIRDEYTNQMDSLRSTVEKANTTLQEAQSKYEQAESDYQSVAKQIEEQHKRIQSPSLAKSSDLLQKLQSSYDDLINQFKTAQASLIAATHDLNIKQLSYSTEMEGSLSAFEETDKKKDLALQELYKSLEAPISAYIDEKKKAATRVREITQKMDSRDDFDKYFKDNDLKPIGMNEVGSVEFHPSELNFNITDFLEPSKLFAKELDKEGAIVAQDFHAVEADDLELSAGSVVTVIGTKGSRSKVVFNGCEGFVPSSYLQKSAEMRRQLFRLTERNVSTKSTELDAKQGEIVMSILIDRNEILCLNAYNISGRIPIAKLASYP